MAVDDGTSLINSGRAYASLCTRALLHILSLRHFHEVIGAKCRTVLWGLEGRLPVAGVPVPGQAEGKAYVCRAEATP